MFRTYTISEVEQICGVSRRTISEYVSKGLLSGPSHRGRGARYPQSDVDALQLLPRFRTLMKREFPNLKALAAFLRQLSIRDLHQLAAKTTESSFVLEVRRLRVRNNLAALAPHVAPERIEQTLAQLTPGQIRAIDSGRYQIGAVLDIASLLQEQESVEVPSDEAIAGETTASVSWLGGDVAGQLNGNAVAASDVDSLDQVVDGLERRAVTRADHMDTQPDLLALAEEERAREEQLNGKAEENASQHGKAATEGENLGERLNEISERLERLELMLAND